MKMNRGEVLQADQINKFLLSSIEEHAEAVLSFTRQGKWRLHHTRIDSFDENTVTLKKESYLKDLVINQPVGICVHLGHFKYLFETSVLSIEPKGKAGHILLDFPDQVEQIQRRAFERQAVPSNLKVKCLFWHRGYLDESENVPAEQYWQGRLLNLSAGGAQIAVDLELKSSFREGQLVGVQFTPMSYEMPLLLEGHVIYLRDQADEGQFLVGVEFLGLEGSSKGREILHRLVQIVNKYDEMNREHNSNSLSA